MNWTLSPHLTLDNDRVPAADAARQTRTAAEILRRFADQPGIVLADEVGMGKTYVALAVAVSVLEATGRHRPVVVLVPPAVADKWPTEWEVFAERCLPAGHGLRAAPRTVRHGSDLLKLLDDPAETRQHLIFVTHGALTLGLSDPFVRLALLRQATRRHPDLLKRRDSLARFAGELLRDQRFRDRYLVADLLATTPSRWRDQWRRWRPEQSLDDDPVPAALLQAVERVDLGPLQDAVMTVPVHRTATFDERIKDARRLLTAALNETWTASLQALDVTLPLVILDEAHHARNDTQLAKLFANDDAEDDAEALQGPLGNMFERMLFLTATPFQLDHRELLRVLDRFHGVRWPSPGDRKAFDDRLTDLGQALDRARATALRLERTWSRIDPADAGAVAGLTSLTARPDQPERVREALTVAAEARTDLGRAQDLLRPWVIRHLKPHKAERRRYLPGRGITDNEPTPVGLAVGGSATLPFLLAARAQAVASLDRSGEHATRAYFAYGLASSYEAYAETRRDQAPAQDERKTDEPVGRSRQLDWYLDRIAKALPAETADEWARHPKIAATVRRVVDLWCAGEKTLVFCFYVETGRALRTHISRALKTEILDRAAAGLQLSGADEDEVLAALDRVGERLLRSDVRGYQVFHDRVRQQMGGLDDESSGRATEIVVRFMRTPSFLVRFADLRPEMTIDDLIAGLDHQDSSGATLTDRISAFARSLGQQVGAERRELLDALTAIQTGGIAATAEHYDPSERSHRRELLLPNVRLANGGVRADTRRRLMLTFNTPFFPEVLVASSVMAEGVDLHQDCRHVIHHDLDWNPSTLEQRNGRVDRIGSKAARTARPVVIYEPYLAGTHDEKMFRVVKDRERWFGVVMGETPDSGEWATERQAARVPLPEAIAAALTMDLSVTGMRQPAPDGTGPSRMIHQRGSTSVAALND
ncbi:DEAD/DEAH box helicase [Catellatospora aurea]|uniref:DEAD/DEAH box helicase n=1 Tax=Catellatospora aurea TaxID=1337874 RepID=A0ABW2H9H8_9ACTN